MKLQSAIGFALSAVVLGLGGSWLGAQAQKTVAIHAGQLFDGKSDRLASNQVIVIQGDRIAEAAPDVCTLSEALDAVIQISRAFCSCGVHSLHAFELGLELADPLLSTYHLTKQQPLKLF